MTFTRFGIELGPVLLTYFGLIVTGAIVAGAVVAYRWVRQQGDEADALLDVLTGGLVGGVLLGRLFYIWNPPPSVAAIYDRRWFLTHFFDLQIGPLAIWSGGLGRAGILLGAAAAGVIVLRRRGLDIRRWADSLVFGLLVMLAILPWANVVNQQMMGPPTTLPWGVPLLRRVPPYDDLVAYPASTRFHPTPAYLSLWTLLALGVVWLAHIRIRSRMRVGDLSLLAAVLYLPGLFAADFLRSDLNQAFLGLSGLQVLAALWFAAALVAGAGRLCPSRVVPDELMPAEEDGARTEAESPPGGG